MSLFILLIVILLERTLKLGNRWQFDEMVKPLFARIPKVSFITTVVMEIGFLALVWLSLWLVGHLLYGFGSFILAVAICFLCIGAGGIRQHYRAYLQAVKSQNKKVITQMGNELTMINSFYHEKKVAKENIIQNALVWINFRFYMAPFFWFIIGAVINFMYIPLFVVGYAVLRAYQNYFAQMKNDGLRKQSGIDTIMHWVDWIPARIAGIAYIILGSREKGLSYWLVSFSNVSKSAYTFLTELASIAFDKQKGKDKGDDLIVNTVSLIKQATILTLVCIIALKLIMSFT